MKLALFPAKDLSRQWKSISVDQINMQKKKKKSDYRERMIGTIKNHTEYNNATILCVWEAAAHTQIQELMTISLKSKVLCHNEDLPKSATRAFAGKCSLCPLISGPTQLRFPGNNGDPDAATSFRKQSFKWTSVV